MDRLESKFDAKLDSLDHEFALKLDSLDGKFDGKFDSLDRKFDVKFDSLKDELSTAKIWALLLYVALATGTFSTMARAFGWI